MAGFRGFGFKSPEDVITEVQAGFQNALQSGNPNAMRAAIAQQTAFALGGSPALSQARRRQSVLQDASKEAGGAAGGLDNEIEFLEKAFQKARDEGLTDIASQAAGRLTQLRQEQAEQARLQAKAQREQEEADRKAQTSQIQLVESLSTEELQEIAASDPDEDLRRLAEGQIEEREKEEQKASDALSRAQDERTKLRMQLAELPQGSAEAQRIRKELEERNKQIKNSLIKVGRTEADAAVEGIDLSTRTEGDVQAKIVAAQESLAAFNNIMENFDDRFLRIPTQFQTAAYSTIERAGFNIPEDQRQQITEIVTFKQDVMDQLNRALAEISGAAIGEAEERRLMAGMPNMKMGPTEFKAAALTTQRRLQSAISRNVATLERGITDDASAPAQPSAQPTTSGLTEEELALTAEFL